MYSADLHRLSRYSLNYHKVFYLVIYVTVLMLILFCWLKGSWLSFCVQKIKGEISILTLLHCDKIQFGVFIYRWMSFFLFILSFDSFCSRNEYLASSSGTNFRPFGNRESVLRLSTKTLVTCTKQEEISSTYIYIYLYVNKKLPLPLLSGFLCDKWFLTYFLQCRALPF